MPGALEVGQYRTHFVCSVTEVFGHYLVGVADTVDETMVVALNLFQYVKQFGGAACRVDQHGGQIPQFP